MRVIWDIFIGDVRNLFRNVIAAIVVMGLALVPPMYAWFTTLGFWDPYSNTGNIKVAVASEDAGYTSDLIPTPINAGEQIIGKLRANDQFAWQFVSADEAVHGVRSGEYYAALVIPKEFSRDLMTVFTDDITEPRIIYYDNEKENAIAQRVTATGASTLQETIDETFTETVASVALGTTSSLTSFMSGDGILTYAQTLGSRLGEAVGEVGAAADQAQAYADLMSSTTSLVDATASILKEAGKAPDATAPLVSEARNGLTSAQDGLSAASTAAEKTLAAADASYDAVARAADEAFATMKDDPAAAQGVLAACRSDVQGLAQAYQTMRDALAGADPSSPAIGALDRIIAQLDTLEANLDTAENAIGADAASIDEKHAKVTDSINQARAALRDSMSTYNDQLKGELASLADSLQKVGADTQTLAGSLKDTADSLGDSHRFSGREPRHRRGVAAQDRRNAAHGRKPARPGPRRPAARPGHRRHRRGAPHHRRQPGRHRPVPRRADAPGASRGVPHGRQRQRHEPLLYLPRAVDRRHLHGSPYERVRLPRAPGRPNAEVRARAAGG